MANDSLDDSFVIVAIPRQEDYVWKLSSEKIPHMTLLYMKKQPMDLTHVTNYIQHVVDTSLCRFGMSVDRRGVFGPKEADVLFFDNFGVDWLKNVRSYFLQNADIRRAYDAVEQYESWTPHLTMGYPETPAKPDDREYPGTNWVQFDRIALWTGNYEGVEFPLKEENSDLVRMSELTESGRAYLNHYGVKGMHWGVRRQSTMDAPSQDAASARETAAKIKKNRGRTESISNKELQALVNRMNLEQQYSRMVEQQPKKVAKGQKFVSGVLSVGKTTNDVISFVNSPAGKLIRKTLLSV